MPSVHTSATHMSSVSTLAPTKRPCPNELSRTANGNDFTTFHNEHNHATHTQEHKQTQKQHIESQHTPSIDHSTSAESAAPNMSTPVHFSRFSSPAASRYFSDLTPLANSLREFTFTPLSAQMNSSFCSPLAALTALPPPVFTFPSAPPTPVAAPLLPQQVLAPAAPTPFIFSQRFQVEKTLSKTIFGQLKLCTDLQTGQQVVVKVSEKQRMNQKHLGSDVQENVEKEAIIMRTAGLQAPSSPLPVPIPLLAAQHVDLKTCGLSERYCKENRVTGQAAAPAELTEEALNNIAQGRQYISSLIGEFDTPHAHYLATEFAAKGDLYNVITDGNAKGTPVQGEAQARVWFKQLCLAVRYLHSLSIAHLDLSVENVCVDAENNIKLIDHGLAARHPEARCQGFGDVDDIVANTGHLASDIFFSPKSCRCSACFSSTEQLRHRAEQQVQQTLTRFPKYVERRMKMESDAVDTKPEIPPSESEVLMEVDSGNALVSASPNSPSASPPVVPPAVPPRTPSDVLRSRCKFLLRPVCRNLCKPGKLSYMSTELTDSREVQQPWDAYAADCFSLGVILFILVTGVPPFVKANESQDTWFRWFITSEWMEHRRYTQPVARHYTKLSPNCWELVDSLFKPQHIRPSIDEILAHPWFDKSHPLSQPIDRLTNRA